MSTTTEPLPVRPTSIKRISRKPVPHYDLSEKYPNPDPNDPFAPLSLLRNKRSSQSSLVAISRKQYSVGPYPPASPGYQSSEQDQSSIVDSSPDELSFSSSRTPHYQDQNSIIDSFPDPELSFSSSQAPHYRLRSHSVPAKRHAKESADLLPHEAPIEFPNRQSYILVDSPARSQQVYELDSILGHRQPKGDVSDLISYGSPLAPSVQRTPLREQSNSPLITNPNSCSSSIKKSRRLSRFLRPKKSRAKFAQADSPLTSSTLPPSLTSSPFSSFVSSPPTSSAPSPVSHLHPPIPKIPSDLRNITDSPKSLAKVNRKLRKVSRASLDSSSQFSITVVPGNYRALSRSELGYASRPLSRTSSIVNRKHQRQPPRLPARPHTSSGYIHKSPRDSFRPHRVDSVPAQTALPPFDENALPTKAQLSAAASLVVVSESGIRVRFGDLWAKRKTVICFIRHFWCSLCQDYMFSISKDVDPKALERANVDLVIISNGSYKMIDSYRRIFDCPFALYTDPTLRVYTALGMTLRTLDGGPKSDKGTYISHGPMAGIAMVVRNAIKFSMPVWEKGGDISQLGGEFVLGPGLTSTYAHRMQNTRGHTPILHVLDAAGVNGDLSDPVPMDSRSMYFMSEEERDMWVDAERRSLATLRHKKRIKRHEIACGIARDAGCGADDVTLRAREAEDVIKEGEENRA